MNKIYIKNIKDYINKEISLDAWIDNIRDLQYVQFVILRDSTGKIQMTVEKNNDNKKLNDLISTLTLESTLIVSAKVLENEKVKLNGIELIPSNIVITSKALPELPIDLKDKEKSLRETRLDYRFLDLRREENNLLFKCQTYIEAMMREYWINNGFMEIHTPKISAASAESGAEMFKLDYFGTTACLSQSPQFYKQMTMASGFEKVFEIGPVFRAENSHTSYHASEILMLDAEISWVNGVDDVMDSEEEWIRYFMTKLKEKYGEEIKKVFNVEVSDATPKFPRIDFYEAKRILKEELNYVGAVAEDFERKEEELMCEYSKNKYNSDFIFITNFPYSARSFYIMKDEFGKTESFDLLFKGVEITSGGQREHRYEYLIENIKEKGLNPKDLEFYTDFFKYGCPPHGGFGVGLARIMMKIFEIDNIREATLIYRGPTRLNP